MVVVVVGGGVSTSLSVSFSILPTLMLVVACCCFSILLHSYISYFKFNRDMRKKTEQVEYY